MSQPWFYPDRVSAEPGDLVRIFASSEVPNCTLIVSRIGLEKLEVARFEGLEIEYHPTPDDADTNGCGWPEAFQFEIASDWRSGYYDLELISSAGESSHHFVCVRKQARKKRADFVLILSTNTYSAYNYWGGSNSYANVEALMAGNVSADESRSGAIGRLSRMRPYPQLMIAPPEDVSRLINLTVRAPGEMPFPGDLAWAQKHRPSPYDGSAGFIHKWEHKFASWAEQNDIELDYITDLDLEADGTDLSGYKGALAVGHSEYWSAAQRSSIERYLDDGGNLAVLSGNTCYWKVRWEDDGDTMIAHKWRGELDDPLWSDPETRDQATHLWSHEAFAAPEASLIGLSFLYGGYHRICMCAARGSAAYTVYNDEHWALKDTDLFYGDQIGATVPLIGYENDGCPISFDANGLPVANGGLGVPDNLEIVAFAPATLAESQKSPFPPMIPAEQPDVLSRIAYGDSSAASQARLMRGHAVMASFKRGAGEVFNAGTTEWAHGLAADDPFVERIMLNVLDRFRGASGDA